MKILFLYCCCWVLTRQLGDDGAVCGNKTHKEQKERGTLFSHNSFSERYRGRHLSGEKLTEAEASGVFSIEVLMVAVGFLADETALAWRSGLGQGA